MRFFWILILVLLLLTGCDDEFFDGGNGDGGPANSGGDSYDAYWNTIETLSAKGYVPEMTQRPESPAPQKECPSVVIPLLTYVFLTNVRKRCLLFTLIPQRVE